MYRTRFMILSLFCLVMFAPELPGQEWLVPEITKTRFSPFLFTDSTRESGTKSYATYCVSCHGSPGKGNPANLVPVPPDPAKDKMQRNSDGELFFKISEGRQQMPSFNNVLSSNDIWNIISYIRSFNTSYSQQIMEKVTSQAYPGAEVLSKFSYQAKDSVVKIKINAIWDSVTLPVKEAALRLFVSRYFGSLPVDEEKMTDQNGEATFRISPDLPGDSAGNIHLIARFVNQEIFGNLSFDTLLFNGNKMKAESLVLRRAMWNKARLSPVWIIMAYTLGMFLVWGFILLVMLKLRDIFIIGELVRKYPESGEKIDE